MQKTKGKNSQIIHIEGKCRTLMPGLRRHCRVSQYNSLGSTEEIFTKALTKNGKP